MFKALLVDDDPFILEGLRHVINWEEHGVEVVGLAKNGLEALDILGKQPVDMLLTDIRMPKMDGLQLLERVRAEGKPIRCMVLSGYDEFKYVKEAIRFGIENYLVKPLDKEELSTTVIQITEKLEQEQANTRKTELREALDVLKDNILQRLVLGTIGMEEFEQKASFLGIRYCGTGCLAAVLKLMPNRFEESTRDRRLLQYAIRNIVEETLSAKNISLFNDMDDEVTVLFYGLEEPNTVQADLSACVRNICDTLKENIFVTRGSLEKRLDSIKHSYEGAKGLLNYSLILEPNEVYDTAKIDRLISREEQHPIDLHAYKNSVLNNQHDEAEKCIDGICEEMRRAQHTDPAFIHRVCYAMLNVVLMKIGGMKNAPPGLLSEPRDLFGRVVKMRTLEELTVWLKEVTRATIHAAVQQEDQKSPLIKEILRYIQNHYNEDIALKSLSDRFHLNTAYLGRLFKIETGELFTNYLNHVRIEKAKEMLTGLNMKANEVSVKVGYQSPDYFYKVFKKMTGVYPSDYKKSMQFD